MPNIATVQVFDFETFSGDPVNANPSNASGALITATLNYNQVNSISPQANLQAVRVQTLTDTTGRWQLNLIPNGNINPANTLWTISTPTQNYQISVPASGPVQSSSVKVASPVTLSPASSTSGPLTVAGAFTVTGGPVSLPAASLGVAALNGILSIANGGTGSATQNFVDLTTNQTIAGAKTFSGNLIGNGSTTLRPAAANQIGVIIQGQPSQTSDFFQIMTNATVVLFQVASNGNATFSGGHVLAAGAQPTLGALQANISSQSISGSNDVRGVVSVTTGATAPSTGAVVAVVTFATAFATVPVVMITDQGVQANTGSFVARLVSTTGFSIMNSGGGSPLTAVATYNIGYMVIG